MTGSPFDALQSQVFDQCKKLFGFSASWQPTAGGAAMQGKVLFNDPSKAVRLADANFNPGLYEMEYHFDTFPGLKTAVDAGEQESVTVGNQTFFVRQVNTDFDGNTYKAILVPDE